jgi:hypothetical protein
MRASQVRERRDERAIRRVDTQLGLVAHRRLMTRDEAIKALFGVREDLDFPEADARVRAIIEDAVHAFGADLVIDRTRVVDPLLEIRSALTLAQVAVM